eukprot:SAG31_NODE_1438_length_8338_cov_18.446413_4_plen_307_part_00
MGDLLMRLRARLGEEKGNVPKLEELEDEAQWQSFVCLQELEDLDQRDGASEHEMALAEHAWDEANRWLRFVREQMAEVGRDSAVAQNALWLLGQGERGTEEEKDVKARVVEEDDAAAAAAKKEEEAVTTAVEAKKAKAMEEIAAAAATEGEAAAVEATMEEEAVAADVADTAAANAMVEEEADAAVAVEDEVAGVAVVADATVFVTVTEEQQLERIASTVTAYPLESEIAKMVELTAVDPSGSALEYEPKSCRRRSGCAAVAGLAIAFSKKGGIASYVGVVELASTLWWPRPWGSRVFDPGGCRRG